jgi:hypothetical protein
MDHNQSTNSNMTSAHTQAGSNDLAFNSFIDGIQAYAEEPISSANNDDFGAFSWNPNLFNNTEQTPTFQQQPTTASQLYTQSISRQPASPALPQYGTSQTNFQNQYAHTTFDPRHLSQPSFENHFLSRMSPSPGPYSSYALQQPMSYPNREQTLQSSQTFNVHPGAMQQRPQPVANQNFASQQSPAPSQYFTYAGRGMQQYAGGQVRLYDPVSLLHFTDSLDARTPTAEWFSRPATL